MPVGVRSALGIAAFAALLWTGAEFRSLTSAGTPLHRLPAAPHGGISLQLASSPEEAQAIRNAWACRGLDVPSPCEDVTPIARQALGRDSRFIAAYLLAFILTILWSASVTHPSRRFVLMLFGLVAIGVACDLVENWALATTLGFAGEMPLNGVISMFPGWRAALQDPGPSDRFEQAVTLARTASMFKFAALMLAAVGTLALVGGAARLLLLARRAARTAAGPDVAVPPPNAQPREGNNLAAIEELLRRENAGIFPNPHSRAPDVPLIEDNLATDEPRVLFRAADVIGLALSGGGIRSATFNLGLLQGLHRLNLLALVDYLSTVSGGGYVGSFWSEWIARQQAALQQAAPEVADPQVPPELLFPSHRDAGSGPQDGVDRAQERHLREFSGFLAPRWGFFEVETWTAVVALISGLLPAVAIALSIIGVLLIGWLSLTSPLAYRSRLLALPIVMGITTVVLAAFERMWHRVKPASAGHTRITDVRATQAEPVRRGISRYVYVSLACIALVGWLQYLLPDLYAHVTPLRLPLFEGGWHEAPGRSAFEQWWTVTGIESDGRLWRFSPRLLDYSVVWLAASLIMVAARVLYPLWPYIAARESLAAYDRVLMRVLGLAVIWGGIALLWHGAMNLRSLERTVAAALVSGGTFAALRNWIGVALNRPTRPGIMSQLKPYVPQILAYTTILLTTVATGKLLIIVAGTDWLRWWISADVMFGFMLLALFIDPAAYGLHAFYRERISRAYTGACNLAEGQNAGDNRATEPRTGDDRRIKTLAQRPLHLVCCAANDLSGDPVETLARGSRSAVISRHGFSIGRYWAPVDALPLGSAITASAAAFNSNMGRVSMEVGPAVAFLMTALNLRLGLWLRHPAATAAGPRRWPGLLLYREMMGLTSASGAVPAQAIPSLMRDIHLSDGGHFENLALYELIRRHCRYILMSDCGADPTVAFDDLGNALRRVREDFGVDISLDVEPLRPGPDGRSRQHVAVGTIHYSPTDQGILVYVKPALTGDEPPDVLQYKTRNNLFPHESTGDQFYDEAQWESYRRLGQHTAEMVFAFVPPAAEPASGARTVSRQGRVTDRPLTADWVFAEATHAWGPTPPGLVDRILEMTKRFADVEAELQRRSRALTTEVFPELTFLTAGTPAAGPPPAGAASHDQDDTTVEDLAAILRISQVMEDVWMACGLDAWWNHPLNLGWINLFARWATAPTFRMWWPVIGPMFSPGFREFLDQRFPTPAPAGAPNIGGTRVVRTSQRARVEVFDPRAAAGLAARWWQERSTQPRHWEGKTLYQNLLLLPRVGQDPLEMQVGIAAVTEHGDHAGWTSEDFFVPPSLWGAGIGWYFLDELLNELALRFTRSYIIVKAPPVDAQHALALDDRRAFIEQYRKIGYREQLPETDTDDDPLDGVLVEALGFDRSADTLLVLDFDRWSRRRGRQP